MPEFITKLAIESWIAVLGKSNRAQQSDLSLTRHSPSLMILYPSSSSNCPSLLFSSCHQENHIAFLLYISVMVTAVSLRYVCSLLYSVASNAASSHTFLGQHFTHTFNI